VVERRTRAARSSFNDCYADSIAAILFKQGVRCSAVWDSALPGGFGAWLLVRGAARFDSAVER
jgi:hypothetical protein